MQFKYLESESEYLFWTLWFINILGLLETVIFPMYCKLILHSTPSLHIYRQAVFLLLLRTASVVLPHMSVGVAVCPCICPSSSIALGICNSRWMNAIKCNTLTTECQHIAVNSVSSRLLPLWCLPEWPHLSLNMDHWVSLIKRACYCSPCSLYCYKLLSFVFTMFTKNTDIKPLLMVSHGWMLQLCVLNKDVVT